MKKTSSLYAMMTLAGLTAAVSTMAIVPPNTASLLSSKNILIIDGTEASGDHYNARIALAAKFTQLRTLVGFTSTTVSGSSPPTNLDPYDIIIFNYWFNNNLSPAGFQNAFRAWVNNTTRRRGWLGVHTSGANEVNEWNWFRDSVTAMLYRVHSGGAQAGTIRRTTVDSIRNHPIMSGLPDTVRIPSDEWYDFAYAPTWGDARVMYYLDESTLPTPLPSAAQMNPHPSTWYRQNYAGNRFFYSALVHNASGVNLTAHNDFFTSMMLRGLEYLAGYQVVSIYLNGKGVHQKSPVRQLTQNALEVSANEPYQVDVFTVEGKRLFSASGKGGEKYNGIFPKAGFYIVRLGTKSETHTQRVLAQF